MKTIRNLLTITVAITLAASTLPSIAFGDDSQAEPVAAPAAATATMASVAPVATGGRSGVGKDRPAVGKAETADASEPRCERVQRIGKFVMTRCD